MKTWIFQGNPIKFNVDDYLLKNDYIWWSIRQEHFVNDINLDDEVFIWRSDGTNKGSGGVVARTKVVTLPQEHTNDEESLKYWYEDVSGDSYLAVELEVLEVEVVNGINRLRLQEHEILSDLLILRLRQTTNYLVADEHASYLRKLWHNSLPVNHEEIHNSFPLAASLGGGAEDTKQLENKFHKVMIEVSKNAKDIGYNPTRFTQMVLTVGGYAVAKKLINSRGLSDGFNILWELNRLDLSVEAVVLRQEFQTLFTEEERRFARERLKEVGYEVLKENTLPSLESSNRSREYEKYDEGLLGKVVYEYLFNGKTPRWLDEYILEIEDMKSSGFESMNILHYLGLRAPYKGIFIDKSFKDSLVILNEKGEEYNLIVRLLEVNEKAISREKELGDNVTKDIESEKVEEGLRNEGGLKYYYGKRYERDSKNRIEAIKHHGSSCVACEFNFEEVYRERGIDFIEVHHINPLSTLGEAVEINPEIDLVPLCANCHRMVHRRKDNVLSIEQLKGILKSIK
ncbi:EVE domain-containing protein [Sporosarcina sp. FA9]|uniref:EVE domain-containing protein n=1 Tax=Sporosarcina sp. FA9 TaxID=3413030 RepID=UPI003F655AF2